jgi:thiosulfate/3-mercaptopyruvate sulfurtransferase
MVVSAGWVMEHLTDPRVRIVEADHDKSLYDAGHIPGAVKLGWQTELQDAIRRDIISRERFAALMAGKGITPLTTVVLYGDELNAVAAYALWVFTLYGHQDVRIMDGGRRGWQWRREQECLPWAREAPFYPATTYTAKGPDLSIRAFRDEVFRQMEAGRPLVDVRDPTEYRGGQVHRPDDRQERAARGGHIPGAMNIPWEMAVDPDDGTLRGVSELRAIYQETHRIGPSQEVITYCRKGDRSSHTWFVLKYLLGYPSVKTYDGSWSEWGNLVGAPIEQ